MRERRVSVLAKAFAVVGIAFACHGLIMDRAETFRGGTITLIVAASAHLHAASRLNAQAVMDHQASLARMSIQDRQRYAEMGYKARCFEALMEDSPATGDADVVPLPLPRNVPPMRRNGSA